MGYLIDINSNLQANASAERTARRRRHVVTAVGAAAALAVGIPIANDAVHNKHISDARSERQEIVASGAIHAGAGITFGKGREVYSLSDLHDPQKDHKPIGTLTSPTAITNFVQARGYDGQEYILTDPSGHPGETAEEFSERAVAIPFKDFDSMSQDLGNLSFISDLTVPLLKGTDNKVSFDMQIIK